VQQDSDGCWKEMDYKNSEALDPHQEVLKLERLEALNTALAELQTNCKKAINLFYVSDLSYREIASQFGISVNTVGSRLSKCLDKLQHRLQRNPLFERTLQ
jgi:RNA polymerase sigma factor (sigma-70 family)